MDTTLEYGKTDSAVIGMFMGGGNIVTVPKIYIKLLGDATNAFVLNYIVGITKKHGVDTFVSFDYEDFEEEIGIKEKTAVSALYSLKKRNLIEIDETHFASVHKETIYVKLNIDEFIKMLRDYVSALNGDQDEKQR